MRITRLGPARFLVALALAGIPLAPAAARQDLPEAIVSRPLTDADAEQIRAFVQRNLAAFSGEDEIAVRRARNALIAPLQRRNVSVEFRLRYTRELEPRLRELVSSRQDFLASNVLRIAGELATPGGAAVISQGLADARPPVRLSALNAAARLFDALRDPTSTPSLSAEQARSLIEAIAALARREQEPSVLQFAILALDAAARVPTAQLAGVRLHAIRTMPDAVIPRVREQNVQDAVPAPVLGAYLRAGQMTRSIFVDLIMNEPVLEGRDNLAPTARLAGHLLALVSRRLEAGVISDAERADLAQLAQLAYATYYFADQRLGGRTPENIAFASLITSGDDRAFQEQVRAIIGPAGTLTKAPYNFPPGEFLAN